MSADEFELFHAALEQPPESRDAWIDRACAGHPGMAAQLRGLITAHLTEIGFLDHPAAGIVSNLGLDEPRLGDTIGPYRLTELLGRGGMGMVYRAERIDASFAQIVALKLMRTERLSAAARARFLLERRILARLDHPHIARLVDGGFSDAQEPWFAMEYVDAEPLLAWCDSRELTLEARLGLFVSICSAVEFAHSHLIVHRDIKPGNVVVNKHGAVKLLDFGIAKLLDQADPSLIGQETLATGTQIKLLTPEYSSPEQVRGEPVTTATDVHALGLLLYELLCGRRAFGAAAGSAFDVQREVLDADPPAMGKRLTQAPEAGAPTAAEIAAARQSEPARLKRALSGDLQHIVDKALRKEPTQRYSTVSALSDDLTRYLGKEPIMAASGARGYRLRKFVARHRASVAFTALIGLTLIGGIVATAWQARRATQQAARAEMEAGTANAVRDFLSNVFNAAKPEGDSDKPISAADLVAAGVERAEIELKDQPLVRMRIFEKLGDTSRQLGRFDTAERLLRRARAMAVAAEGEDSILSITTAIDLVELGNDMAGASAAELSDLDKAIEVLRRNPAGREEGYLIRALKVRGLAETSRDPNRAVALQREVVALARTRPKEPNLLTDALIDLGERLTRAGKDAEAIRVLRDALKRPPSTTTIRQRAHAKSNLGMVLLRTGATTEGESMLREAAEDLRRLLGEDHPDYANALHYLASGLTDENKLEEAEKVLDRVLAIYEKNMGQDSRRSAYIYNDIAVLRNKQGRLPEAIVLLRKVVAILTRDPDQNADLIVTAGYNLAELEYRVGDYLNSERDARRLIGLLTQSGFGNLDEFRRVLGRALRMQGRADEAILLLRKSAPAEGSSEAQSEPVAPPLLLEIAFEERDLGRLDEARGTAKRALAGFERDPSTRAEATYTRYLLAQIDVLQGRCLPASANDIQARWEDRKAENSELGDVRAAEAGLVLGLCREQIKSEPSAGGDPATNRALIRNNAKAILASSLSDPFLKRLAQQKTAR